MAKVYTIDRTEPTTYLNNSGRPVEGYRIFFTMAEFGEGDEITMPDMNADAINKRIMEIITARQRLAQLGG